MKSLRIFGLFVACVFGGAVVSTLVTTIVWNIQIEPRAFQCNDTCGWPFDNYWGAMGDHKAAGDAISPGWTWEELKTLREIYIAAFFLLWAASTLTPFRVILLRSNRPNHGVEPTGASRSAQSGLVAQRRLAHAAHAGRWVERG